MRSGFLKRNQEFNHVLNELSDALFCIQIGYKTLQKSYAFSFESSGVDERVISRDDCKIWIVFVLQLSTKTFVRMHVKQEKNYSPLGPQYPATVPG